MKTFEVIIKERGTDHPLHTSYTGPDETTVATVEAWFGVHNDDVESYEIHEVADLDKPQEQSVLIKQYTALKAKHPDAILLFRRAGDCYEAYCNDADDLVKILDVSILESTSVEYGKDIEHKEPDGNPLRYARFSCPLIDTYLPKLIRAGKRVAFCEQLEDPNKKSK